MGHELIQVILTPQITRYGGDARERERAFTIPPDVRDI